MGRPGRPRHRGMGHHGMRYRADLIGASYAVDGTEGGGLSIRVTLQRDAVRKPPHVRTAER